MLTLSFSNDAQRDEFTQDFDAYLIDNGFLSAADPRERILVVEPLNQNVVLHGRQGLNYSEPYSEQILLSAAPQVLEGLIDRYAETTGGLEDTAKIELQMGEIKVEGLESTRSIVRALAVPEERRRMLGEASQAADWADDTAADADVRLSVAQWREHFAQLDKPTKAKEGQPAVAKKSGAEKDSELARSNDDSGQAADNKTSELKKAVPQEEQAAAAGARDQDEVRSKKQKRRARSAKGRRLDEIELFGDLDESPPASESAGSGSRGAGAIIKRPKSPGPSRPTGRAPNLTFVLKLQTVPPAKSEPILEMGPPAPPPESDDSEK